MLMPGYHKIDSVYKRDPADKYKRFLTDQYTRPEFELLKDIDWTWTEKIDGTNVRVGWDGAAVQFGGRTDAAQMPMRLLTWLQSKFTPELMTQVLGVQGGIVLYGEGYGPGIQDGGYDTNSEQRFILFDVLATDQVERPCWFARESVVDFAGQLGIDIVPVVGHGTIAEAIEFVKVPRQSPCGTRLSEGIVLRPTVELLSRFGGRIITKLKLRDFVVGQEQ